VRARTRPALPLTLGCSRCRASAGCRSHVTFEDAVEVGLVIEAAVQRDGRGGRTASQVVFGSLDPELVLVDGRRHAQLGVKCP